MKWKKTVDNLPKTGGVYPVWWEGYLCWGKYYLDADVWRYNQVGCYEGELIVPEKWYDLPHHTEVEE